MTVTDSLAGRDTPTPRNADKGPGFPLPGPGRRDVFSGYSDRHVLVGEQRLRLKNRSEVAQDGFFKGCGAFDLRGVTAIRQDFKRAAGHAAVKGFRVTQTGKLVFFTPEDQCGLLQLRQAGVEKIARRDGEHGSSHIFCGQRSLQIIEDVTGKVGAVRRHAAQ